MGCLPQNFGLYDELTVHQFLDYMACLKGLPAPHRQAVDACIERAALTEKAEERSGKETVHTRLAEVFRQYRGRTLDRSGFVAVMGPGILELE